MTEEEKTNDFFEITDDDLAAEMSEEQQEQPQEQQATEQEPQQEASEEQDIDVLEEQVEDEISKDMSIASGQEQQEYTGDQEKFNSFMATPQSGDIYPTVDNKQILNKDLPNSYLSSNETSYLELLNIGMLSCLDEPMMSATFVRYARYVGFKANIAPAKGGWGRTQFNTSVNTKKYSIDSVKRQERRGMF